jgi:hypothetical protein
VAAPVYPIINGVAHSWANVEITAKGQIFTGVVSISYTATLEPGEVRGTGSQVIARTQGEETLEASIELLKADAQELIDALGDGFGMVPFEIVVNYAPKGLPVITDTLKACRITSPQNDHSQGPDGLTVSFDLHPMAILYNGKQITPNSLF